MLAGWRGRGRSEEKMETGWSRTDSMEEREPRRRRMESKQVFGNDFHPENDSKPIILQQDLSIK